MNLGSSAGRQTIVNKNIADNPISTTQASRRVVKAEDNASRSSELSSAFSITPFIFIRV
jgi:hypothetical protein